MQTQTPKKYYTPEEYLQLEETSESKNEYRVSDIYEEVNFDISEE